MSELFNLAMDFCQSGNPLPKAIILKVLEMNKAEQAQFLGEVAVWCSGAQVAIQAHEKAMAK